MDWKAFKREERPACLACPRFGEGTFVGPEIRPGASILGVAEAPGRVEMETGVLLSGPSGKIMDGLWEKAGTIRERVSLANTVCCYLPDNPTPEIPEIQACAGLLDEAIREADPKVIVALGAVATMRLIGKKSVQTYRGGVYNRPKIVELGMTTVPGPDTFKTGARAGQLKPHRVMARLQSDDIEPLPVVMTFHPAEFLHRGFDIYSFVLTDLRRARLLAESPSQVRSIEQYTDISVYGPDEVGQNAARKIIAGANGRLTADTETQGLDGKLTVIGVGSSLSGCSATIPSPSVMQATKEFVENPENTLIGQNITYDVKVLSRLNIEVRAKLWDTMHAAGYERPDLSDKLKPKSLEIISSRMPQLRYQNWKTPFKKGDQPDIFQYCTLDVAHTQYNESVLRKSLENTGRLKFFERDMMPALVYIGKMEREGVRVDMECWERLRNKQVAIVQELERQWGQATGSDTVEWASAKDLRRYYYDVLKLKEQHLHGKRTGPITLDREALENLVKLYPKVTSLVILLRLRHAAKILSTCLKEPINGRYYAQYDLTGTETSRLSGDFQQWPRAKEDCPRGVLDCGCSHTRELFIADEGDYAFAVADSSQIEFRLWGVLSPDSHLMMLYKNPEFDIHGWVAKRLNIPRQLAKTIVHGVMFGMMPARVAKETGQPIALCVNAFNDLLSQFPATARYKSQLIQHAKRQGYITNPFGTRIYTPLEKGNVKETEVYAGAPQSTAGSMMVRAIKRAGDAGLKLRLSLHDELGISARSPKEIHTLKEVMQSPHEELGNWGCPAEVGEGRSWFAAKMACK